MIGKNAAAEVEPKDLDDSILVHQFQRGQLEAYEHLFDRYSLRIYNYIVRVTNDRTAAEDLLQETFLRVFTQAHRLRSDTKFSGWLYKIATNLCRDHFRRAVRREQASEELSCASSHSDGSEQELLERERAEQAIRALRNLPTEHQAALLLKYVEGLPYRQIATALSMSEAAVTSLLYRARAEMRHFCGSAGEER
jgi:RNA polymerase sigma-70 factor, ECF subfamily